MAKAREAKQLSAEQYSVAGTLIQARAAQKGARPRDNEDTPPTQDGNRNPTADYRGQSRSNAPHAWRIDRQARLYRKSQGS